MLGKLKDFLLQGNILELAVAVLVAGAFGAIVTSFTNDIVMPPLGILIGGVDFADLQWTLKAAEGDTPAVTIGYGKFINTLINFLIVGIVLFYVKSAYDRVNPPAPAGPSQEDLLAEIRDLLKK